MWTAIDEADRLGYLPRNQILEEAPSMTFVISALLFELAGRDRRHEGIRVDLAVRVVKRDADLHAAVFERVDVSDVRTCAERVVTLGPDVDEQAEMAER